MQVQLQRERASVRAPLPLLVLSPVLLLNEHYCWSGRAPLNSAGAPQAERSERAALIPPPLCCPAWRHFGGGFPTDKADIKPSRGVLHQGEFSLRRGPFYTPAHERRMTPQVSFFEFGGQ